MGFAVQNNFISTLSPLNLFSAARDVDLSSTRYGDLFEKLERGMNHYNGDFGPAMVAHQKRVAENFAAILTKKNYDANSVAVLKTASLYHDIGKILQRPSIWGLEEKPTEEIRAQRRDHVFLGPHVLAAEMQMLPGLENDPLLSIMACLQTYHHERINGKGPNKLSGEELGDALEILGIVDALDGKATPRNIRPDQAGFAKEMAENIPAALREMTGDPAYANDPKKHAGEFRPELLRFVIAHFEETLGVKILEPQHKAAAPTLAI